MAAKTTPAADLTSAAISSDRGSTGSLLDAKGQLPQDLTIEWRKISTVRAYPDNPRDNQPAIPDVKQSLVTFGWQQPIVVDTEGVIIVGHTRYYAALDLQQHMVPVYVARHLTEAQAIAYRLADNKTNERATWKLPLLKGEFGKLQALHAPLGSTGFRLVEWEGVLGPVAAPLSSGAGPGKPSERTPVTCPQCHAVFTP